MSYITFEKIWEDYDGMLELLISASNRKFSCSQTIYIYPDEILSFSKKLSNFPQAIDDMIELEYGSDNPKVYCYFLLRMITYNRAGHIAIEIKTDNHQENIEYGASHFFIKTESSFMNKLGRMLTAWLDEMSKPLTYEWDMIE